MSTPHTAVDRALPTHLDAATRKRLEKLAYWLDDRFRIPVINRRIGLDGLIGLVPGVGDTVMTAVSAYIVVEAHRLGVPPATLARMVANLAIDGVIGSIPIFGDLFDIANKANRKNIALLNRHLDRDSQVALKETDQTMIR